MPGDTGDEISRLCLEVQDDPPSHRRVANTSSKPSVTWCFSPRFGHSITIRIVDTNTVDVDAKVQFVKIGLIYDFSIGKNLNTLHCDDIDKSVRSQYKKSFGFPSRRMRLIYT